VEGLAGAAVRGGGYRGLVYSRYGYGDRRRVRGRALAPDFMHVHAAARLPRCSTRCTSTDAALARRPQRRRLDRAHPRGAHSDRVAGVIAIAPHIMVEDLSIASIERARDAYRTTDLRARLARYHADPDSAFWGWNDVWLDPKFRDWSIEAMLARIRCPVLAIQGRDDEYGTLAQVEGIRARVPGAELEVLDHCGHSPHRDQPAALTRAVTDFISRHAVALDNAGGMQ
jgi:pimeloyl-ACP methyl ester carboxylesterase